MAKLEGIFLIKGEARGVVRVTCTHDLRKRFSEWQAASPCPLTVVGMATELSTVRQLEEWLREHAPAACGSGRLADPKDVCAALKRAFAGRCIRGDWFRLDEATVKSLPLERLKASDRIGKVPPSIVLSIYGRTEEFPHQGQALALPPAPTVWAAVDHAKARAAKRKGLSDDEWLAAMAQYVVAWLVAEGRKDVSTVIRFHEQYQGLQDKVAEVLGYYSDNLWDTCAWLVLQGAATFSNLWAEPLFWDKGIFSQYEACYVYRAFDKLTPSYDCIDITADIDEHLAHGGKVQDFAGWSAFRFNAVMTKGAFPLRRRVR